MFTRYFWRTQHCGQRIIRLIWSLCTVKLAGACVCICLHQGLLNRSCKVVVWEDAAAPIGTLPWGCRHMVDHTVPSGARSTTSSPVPRTTIATVSEGMHDFVQDLPSHCSGSLKDSDRNNGVGHISFINLNLASLGRPCWV